MNGSGKIRIRLILYSFCATGLLIALHAVGFSSAAPHAFRDDECANCHSEVPQAGQKGPFPMVSRVSKLCRQCHKSGMKRLSHPVDFKPKTAVVPPEFPLSFDGSFTCSTCHNIHSEGTDPSGLKTYFLRKKIGQGNFCVLCHRKEPFSHKTLLAAHMKNLSWRSGSGSSIDEISIQCLACHDGLMAKGADTTIQTKPPSSIFCCPHGGSMNHPIGMNYRVSRRQGANLRSLNGLDKSIKLFRGRVGCGSCHDPYSKNRKMLVINNDRNGLCLECHLKKEGHGR